MGRNALPSLASQPGWYNKGENLTALSVRGDLPPFKLIELALVFLSDIQSRFMYFDMIGSPGKEIGDGFFRKIYFFQRALEISPREL